MHLIRHSLPAMIFVAFILGFYLIYAKLWVLMVFRKYRKKPVRKLLIRPVFIIMHCLAALGIFCFLYALLIEPYWLDVNFVNLQTDKLDDTTFRVVHFSDTHCDPKIRLEKKLPKVINELKPDVIVFTGDAINSPAGLENFQTMMREMEAPLGKFAIRGNWDVDFWGDINVFENTGFQEMTMDKATVEKDGRSIIIAGLSFDNGPKSVQVVGKLKKDDYNVLLYHNTDLMDYYGEFVFWPGRK